MLGEVLESLNTSGFWNFSGEVLLTYTLSQPYPGLAVVKEL
jgi:hypothetical protein